MTYLFNQIFNTYFFRTGLYLEFSPVGYTFFFQEILKLSVYKFFFAFLKYFFCKDADILVKKYPSCYLGEKTYFHVLNKLLDKSSYHFISCYILFHVVCTLFFIILVGDFTHQICQIGKLEVLFNLQPLCSLLEEGSF